MARIFWITCPACKRRFYAATVDFKGYNRKLRCPFCGARFTDKEAEAVNE